MWTSKSNVFDDGDLRPREIPHGSGDGREQCDRRLKVRRGVRDEVLRTLAYGVVYK